MEAKQYSIDEILTGREVKYFIPTYQRPYIWDSEKAVDLIRDIYESYADNNEKEYFAGSIICINNKDDGSRQRYEVVDGQQRLITLTLIMQQLATFAKNLATHAKESESFPKNLIEKIEGVSSELKKRIMPNYLFSGSGSVEPVLTVRETERDFYLKRILQDNDSFPQENDMQKVFANNQGAIKIFLSELEEKNKESFIINFSDYLLHNVYVVFVTVDDRASSFRLFNVLNNRGMPLADSDLIKNLLLEKVDGNKDASEQVAEMWRRIEDFVEEEDEKNEIEKFFTFHQISEKNNLNRRTEKNFDYYEKMLKKFNGDSVKMTELLYNSARNYKTIIEFSEESKISSFIIRQFLWKEERMPVFMAFLNKKFTKEQFFKFIELFEKVYMQIALRRGDKSLRTGICYYVLEAINTDKSFNDIMVCVASHANNQKFEEALGAKEFYDSSRPTIINLVKLILLRLDRERHDDSAQVTYSYKTVTVEHILPQNKDDEYWTSRFTQEQHEEWLHKLGNLTVISRGKNSAAKNHGFDKKKVMYATSSNKKTSLEITKELCELPEWNMQALEDRHKKLKDEIKKLWGVEAGLCSC